MWERDGEEMCRGMGGYVGEGWGGGNSEEKFVLSARDGGDSSSPGPGPLEALANGCSFIQPVFKERVSSINTVSDQNAGEGGGGGGRWWVGGVGGGDRWYVSDVIILPVQLLL